MNFKDLNNKLKVSIKKGDLFDKIFCYGLIKIGYSNNLLQALEIRNKNYLYIKKKYGHVIKKYCNNSPNGRDGEKIIWVLWLQGIEHAPEIVKCCIESIFKHKGEYKVQFLTAENMFNYVNIPDYIIKKWKNGIITNTHLSDIIRTDLLIRYGGIWLDATTYLTGDLPSYVIDSSFFAYKRGNTRDKTILANNWLLSSNKDTRLLLCVRELLFEYWKKEKKLKEYFIWQLCMTISIECYPKDWENVLWVPDVLPEMMRWNLFKKKENNSFDEITKMTSIHKLSYKIQIPSNTEGTIYEYILSKEEENDE